MLRKLLNKDSQTPKPIPKPEISRTIEENPESFGQETPAEPGPSGRIAIVEAPEPAAQRDLTLQDNQNNTEGDMSSQSEKATGGATAAKPRQQQFHDEEMSVIGASLAVKGELEAAENLIIEGQLEGSIRHTSERLIIGRSGTVRARIEARNLTIEGTVDGDIVSSESVVILDTAKVSGNIYTPRISIADGAQFNGSVDMEVANRIRH